MSGIGLVEATHERDQAGPHSIHVKNELCVRVKSSGLRTVSLDSSDTRRAAAWRTKPS